METHEHHHEPTANNESWLKRHRWLTYVALGILAYFLLIEHRAHVVPFLPFLILAACPLMHIFMHKGHGHSDNKKEQAHESH